MRYLHSFYVEIVQLAKDNRGEMLVLVAVLRL